MNKISLIRLNKYLANLGVASRRKVEELILQRKITVNGRLIKDLGTKIDPEKDQVLINGKEVGGKEKLVYILLNKPKGVFSTVSDERDRKTVLDLVKVKERLYPVGRLDKNSTGLIILTNDGELAYKLTHPKFEVLKTYQLIIGGKVSLEQVQRLQEGVFLKDGKTAPAKVKILKETDRTYLQITLHEGKNREIRRMCGALRLNLLELKRIAIGGIQLRDLETGKSRELNEEEVGSLKSN